MTFIQKCARKIPEAITWIILSLCLFHKKVACARVCSHKHFNFGGNVRFMEVFFVLPFIYTQFLAYLLELSLLLFFLVRCCCQQPNIFWPSDQESRSSSSFPYDTTPHTYYTAILWSCTHMCFQWKKERITKNKNFFNIHILHFPSRNLH